MNFLLLSNLVLHSFDSELEVNAVKAHQVREAGLKREQVEHRRTFPVAVIIVPPITVFHETFDPAVTVEYDERLNEQIISLKATDRPAIKELKRRVRQDHAFVPPDGESVNQAADRFIRALREISQTGLSRAALVSHCQVIQAALLTLFSLNEVPKIDEASITALSCEGGKFSTPFVNKKIFSLPVIFMKVRRKLGF